MDQKFTVAFQYQLFLKRIAMSEDNMHPLQRRQLKQAFYGAWGQCQIHVRDEVAALSEDEGVAILEAEMKEVGDFFLAQTSQQN